MGGIIILISGVVLRVYERTTPDSKFNYIWNSFWVLLVTQTTVGYGDIIPQTHLGRFFIMLTCILGTFLVSYFVISTASLTVLESAESQFMGDLVASHDISKKLKPTATVTIQRWWRYILKRKRKQPRTLEIWKYMNSLFAFNLRQKKLIAAEAESIGDIAEKFVENKDKALEKTVNHLKGFKGNRVRQEELYKMQQQLKSKLDRYEGMLRKYAPKRRRQTTSSVITKKPSAFSLGSSASPKKTPTPLKNDRPQASLVGQSIFHSRESAASPNKSPPPPRNDRPQISSKGQSIFDFNESSTSQLKSPSRKLDDSPPKGTSKVAPSPPDNSADIVHQRTSQHPRTISHVGPFSQPSIFLDEPFGVLPQSGMDGFLPRAQRPRNLTASHLAGDVTDDRPMFPSSTAKQSSSIRLTRPRKPSNMAGDILTKKDK
jgi:hypothetical protein